MTVTPSPQSVVVPREPTIPMLNAGWSAVRPQGIDPEELELDVVWSAMLAAAPDPSSLAGGAFDHIHRLAVEFNPAMHDIDQVLSEINQIALAALSPEAPARVGAEPDGMTEDERRRWLAGRSDWREDEWQDHCGRHGCEECRGEIPMTRPRAALTPRHEAPAEGAGEWITGDQLHAIMQSFTDRADVSEIASKINAAITLRARSSAPEAREEPVEVTIFCPQCALPHVDEGDWATTRRHKTHQCQGCGHEWRPFPFATVGVSHPEALNRMERVAKFFDDGGPDFLSSADSRQHGRDIRSVVSAFREGEPVGWKYEVFGPEGRSRSVRSVIGPKPNVAAPVGGYVLYDALYAHPDAPSADKLRIAVGALDKIADEAPYRSGYCQSDVDYAPKLTDFEMQAEARQALMAMGFS